MRIQDINWMQLEEYLREDDRIVLPLGSSSSTPTCRSPSTKSSPSGWPSRRRSR